MASFTTGKSASSAVKKGGSVSSGSFVTVPRVSSSKTGSESSSFKVGKVPASSFSSSKSGSFSVSTANKGTTSFSTPGKKSSSFGSGTPTPTPVKAVVSTPVKTGVQVTDNYLGTNVKKTTGKFVQPVLVTDYNNKTEKIKPVTPVKTITFKQATSSNTYKPNLPVKESTRPIYRSIPMTNQEIIDTVKKFKNNYINPPENKSKAATSSTLINSKSGSGKSSGKWGGTGSLKATSSLSAGEKAKKGITGSSYTQGSDKTTRSAKSYNTGKAVNQ